MEDRCIIRNTDYFSPNSPRGPPAFWISRCLVTLAVFGNVPTCKTSSRSYGKVSPEGARLTPDWFISVSRSVCKPVKSTVVTAGFAKGIAPGRTKDKRAEVPIGRKGGRAQHQGTWKGREVLNCCEKKGTWTSQTLPLSDFGTLVCRATVMSTSPFGNSCVSLFQRYFSLIYQIPQDRSIFWLWQSLPP